MPKKSQIIAPNSIAVFPVCSARAQRWGYEFSQDSAGKFGLTQKNPAFNADIATIGGVLSVVVSLKNPDPTPVVGLLLPDGALPFGIGESAPQISWVDPTKEKKGYKK